jgi:hypothetical protein
VLRRFIILGAVAVVGFCLVIALWPREATKTVNTTVRTVTTRSVRAEPKLAGGQPAPVVLPAGNCAAPDAMRTAAADNAESLTARAWSPWGRAETGWEIYAPLVAVEVGTACPPDTPGFAAALSRWQLGHKLAADGVLDSDTFEAMRVLWLRRRPFVIGFSKGVCPAAADPAALAWADKAEGYSGKPIQLTIPVLAAYRSLVAAARKEVPEVAADPKLLTVFSGYRAPAEDEARCDQMGDCGTIARARCSAHRTGTAVDLYLGAAPGYRPESSEDPNRLHQSRSPAYRWMAANASRFGFVPYPFEPWHWEWAGEASS